MRLDHLLSRERTQREIREFIPGRYTGNCVGARKSEKPKEAKKSKQSLVERLFFFLNLYRFQGSESESSTKPECTLKTAQPDGKHLVKKPVANVLEITHERRNANNFAVGLRRKSNQRLRNQSFDSYSD